MVSAYAHWLPPCACSRGRSGEGPRKGPGWGACPALLDVGAGTQVVAVAVASDTWAQPHHRGSPPLQPLKGPCGAPGWRAGVGCRPPPLLPVLTSVRRVYSSWCVMTAALHADARVWWRTACGQQSKRWHTVSGMVGSHQGHRGVGEGEKGRNAGGRMPKNKKNEMTDKHLGPRHARPPHQPRLPYIQHTNRYGINKTTITWEEPRCSTRVRRATERAGVAGGLTCQWTTLPQGGLGLAHPSRAPLHHPAPRFQD